jgi:hypothetical protein
LLSRVLIWLALILAVAELRGEDWAVWQHLLCGGRPWHHCCISVPSEHHHPPWKSCGRDCLHLQGLQWAGAYHSPMGWR